MLGEFAREVAVLLLVFVPLDWWRPNVSDPNLLWHVGEATFGLLAFGMLLEYVSLGAIRAKQDLEGNRDGE
jgi:hypothetical protein